MIIPDIAREYIKMYNEGCSYTDISVMYGGTINNVREYVVRYMDQYKNEQIEGSIAQLEIDSRTYNILSKKGINTIDELRSYIGSENNLTPSVVTIINVALNKYDKKDVEAYTINFNNIIRNKSERILFTDVHNNITNKDDSFIILYDINTKKINLYQKCYSSTSIQIREIEKAVLNQIEQEEV